VSIGKKYWTRAIGNRIIFIIFLNGKLRKRSLFNINERPWQTSHSSAGMVRNFPELRRCAHPDTGHVSADPDRRWVILLHIVLVYLLYINKMYSNTVGTSSRKYIYIMYTYVYIFYLYRNTEVLPVGSPSRPRGGIKTFLSSSRNFSTATQLRPFRVLRADELVLE